MSSIINTNTQVVELTNEEMDLEFQEMREYDEIIQAIAPIQAPSLEDLHQQTEEQEETEQPEEECVCACCRGTCACGRGHICDEEHEDNSWRDDWYYNVHESGLDWNEGGYYD